MFPYKSIIQINKKTNVPVYVQVANTLAREIRNGLLKPGTKLPGARSMATLLTLNRNTVTAVYDELNLQGYVELLPKKGAFVSARIPEITPKPIEKKFRSIHYPETAGFHIRRNTALPQYTIPQRTLLEFNDGLPDERIAPLNDFARTYRSLYKRKSRFQFTYSDSEGNPALREMISQFVNETRGLQTTAENIFITRGSQMGIYLIAQLLLQKGDIVITGQTSYFVADATFQYAGASLHRVRVDALGMDADAVEQICKKKKVRAVYVTPHHHFPTTTMLSACRRMKLLQLAEKYGFAILEDDYDYDFHYASSPILPMASSDNHGMVINFGSMSKNFSPALRVAYLVAPKNIIAELSALRFIIDRQGDYLVEQTLAELFKEGIIKRHLRKALLSYHERRDLLCSLLAEKLGDVIDFRIPEGGLAVWASFDKKHPLTSITAAALKHGLVLNNGSVYNVGPHNLNSTRIGFASLNIKELERAVKILETATRST